MPEQVGCRGEKRRCATAAERRKNTAERTRAEDDFFARSRRGVLLNPGRAPIFPDGNRKGINKINGKSEKNDYFY